MGFLLLFALLAIPSVGLAQDANIVDEVKEKRRKEILEGTEAFRRLLFDEKFEALNDFADLTEQPATKMLIVLGNLDILPEGIVNFVRAGGAVLLASDRPLRTPEATRQLLALSGVEIASQTLQCANLDACYKRHYCPFVVPMADCQPNLFFDPQAERSRNVATNVPSFLIMKRRLRQVQAIATLPEECSPDEHEIPFQIRGGNLPLFAVAGEVGQGRVLVMADHSVFINEMMLPTDNGNFDFTSSAVAWLRGDDSQRTKVLFIDERGIQTKFQIPLKSLNIPPEEALRLLFEKRNEILVAAENVVGRLENEGAFDRGAMNVFDRAGFPPARLVRYALVGVTTLLGLYAICHLGFRHRFKHDLTAPMLTTLLDRNLPVAALAAQRHLTLLTGGNLEEPARQLARHWFTRFGIEAFDGPMPNFEAKGGWWMRRRLSARLREVWRLATGKGGRVRLHRLAEMDRDLSDLRAAHERGEWRLSAAVIEV